MIMPFVRDRNELLRWVLSGAAVVFLHGAVAAAVVHWNDDSASEPTAALVVDLAPFPTAPPETIDNVPPGPLQPDAVAAQEVAVKEVKEEIEERPETEPSRDEVQPELLRAVNPEVVLDATPPKPEQKAEIPQQAQLASEASAPPPIPEAALAAVSAAPIQGPPNVDRSNALLRWQSTISAVLERNKRYPAEARNDRGTVHVEFILDRQGHVMSRRVVTTSGSSALDREALEMIKRSQFPPPPAAVPDTQLSFTVPVRFNMR
jgi:protein TonB